MRRGSSLEAISIINTAPICPSCDFNRHSPGAAQPAGAGLWKCAECGSTWRDVGEAPPLVPIHIIESQTATDSLAVLRPGTAWRTPLPGGSKSRGQPLLAAVAGIIILAIAALGWQAAAIARSSIDHLTQTASIANRDALTLSGVSVQRLMRGGQLAVRVEGRITNNTGMRQAMAPLDIVVMRNGGQQVGHWSHVPALAQLEPGQTIRFSTAKADIGGPADEVEIDFAGMTMKTRM